jgi:hypothetical protein
MVWLNGAVYTIIYYKEVMRMIRKLFGAVIAALAVVPAVSAAEACADSMVCKLNSLWLVAPAASIIALIVAVIFFAIGVGIMALLGNSDTLETMDSDLLTLLGALAVLAAFGILFAVIAIIRKIKRR